MNPRTIAAVIAGKLAGAASRTLGRGGGTAVAGLAALRIDPALVSRLGSQAGAGAIAVTGTNGKTTTSLMLNRIATAAGLRPLHNRSGSNLMRGVAAMLVEEATLMGAVPGAAHRIAILEVDEATLPEIASAVPLRAIVFTNLFRDQLDRYGEVDTVAKAWERALRAEQRAKGSEQRDERPVLVLNADDPAVAHLGREAGLPVLYYGVEDASAGGPAGDHASDFRTCLQCGGELAYAATFYGHVGHWRCPACGTTRPRPDARATRVVLGDDATALRIETDDGEMNVALPLTGLYNAYNALAAAAGALALGLPRDAIVPALESFTAAFGRQERFSVDGRDVRVLLGKNPTGLNQVLRTIAAAPGEKRVVFFLNDGIADGRDVSWIWDADYEITQPQTAWVLAAGNRAEDLALRLKYAGYGDDVRVEHDTEWAVRRALQATPPGQTLYVIPTYTAMLEVRELLAKRAGAAHYWDEKQPAAAR
ncbi:MAG TPA: MurT ligase domain-containing protein [Dehalococcoidia bacterium]|nr:MurT ligase domain-containing protein [Dehalococcoidia bacterium]